MKRLRRRETVGSKQLRVVMQRRPADFIAQSLWGLFNTKGACDGEKLSEASNGESPSSACPDPTPIAFFRYICPAHRNKATDKYRQTLDLASNIADNQELRDKLKIMKETVDDIRILRDWEIWLQEKTAILVRRGVRNTNLNLHKEINTLALNKRYSSAKNTNSNQDSDVSEEDREEELNLYKEINALALNKGESSAKNTSSNPAPNVSDEDREELNLYKEINALALNKGESSDPNFFMNRGNYEKLRNGVTSNDINHISFVERIEESKPITSTSQRPWILRSGTNVGEKLTSYVKTIPESQKCLNLAYWNILDLTDNTQIKSLFSTNDWEEMVESFNNEVKLIESDFLDVVEYFFHEVEKATKEDNKDIVNAIDRLTPEIIETIRKVELSDEEKNVIAILRRAVVIAENLERVDLPVSEADFDNAFPNMLAKRFLNKEELKMDGGEIACWASACRRNEGRSVVLRARVGQKCDFRGILKKSINRLEALIGLRSGGLPEPHQKKIHEDKVDLSVAMRDILYTFFKENSKAPSSDVHSTFVFGIHSWGWVHNVYGMDCKATNLLRLGGISHLKMPNTLKTLSVLESFYVLFKDLQVTLNTICEHTNSVSLAHSRAHRNRKRKNLERAGEKGGSFGNPSQTPINKKTRNYDH
ncbi:3461_t:CDS:10 [Cetraspora pellucida]|uniref:3461_t:CDS:1 n=1 Tax=Cetraspora pellucida TaxID=1433469 RepID=A0A9N8VFV7_9GLOM|nr:3461_t:CDS:10 [Cetraspora pellucida]